MQLQGLRLDGKFADSPKQTWAYAKNVLLSRGFDELENEAGDLPLITNLTGSIIGRIVTPTDIILFIWDTTKTYIKHVSSSNVVTDLISSGTTYINLNPTRTGIYIEGVHCYNNEGDLIIAWTNGLDKPMILNVTEAIAAPLTITANNLKNLYLFPEIDHNNFGLTTSSIITGGRLPAAAYFFSLTYEIEPDVNTNFGVISNPVFITEEDALTSYKQFKGNASLVVTDKAIQIDVSDLDTNYSYFKLAVIQKTETGTNCYITSRYKNLSGTGSVIIDDLDKLVLYDLVEVTTSTPGFSAVKTITQSNRRLRMGNVTKPTKLSLNSIYTDILTPRTLTVSSASRSGSTTVTVVSNSHGLLTGAIVTMNGWNIAAYNGHFVITKVDNNTFQYTTTSGTDTATGGTCKTDILEVNWISEKAASLSATKNSYKDSVFIFNSRGFRSDEVYALYLGLRLKTGGYYGIYHIPGREKFTGEDTATTVVDGETIDNYKLGSTATRVANYYGKMGLWENEDEQYSSAYGSKLNGQKVRHHRFPSLGQICTWKGSILNNVAKGTIVQALSFGSCTSYEIGTTDQLFGILPLTSLPSLGTYVAASSSPLKYTNSYTASYTQLLEIALNFNVRLIDTTAAGGTATFTVTKQTKTLTGYTSTVLHGPETKATASLNETLNFTHNEDVTLAVGDILDIQIEINQLSTHAPAGTPTITTTSTMNVYEATLGQDILGLRIALDWNNVNSATKLALEDVIDGWEILYAKRTLTNQLILDQSLTLTDGGGFRFYGFDSMANLLNLEPTHAKSELIVDDSYYTAGPYSNEVFNYSIDSSTRLSKINRIKYLPAYNTATVPSNENRENCYYFETAGSTFHKKITNLMSIKNNLYLDFSNYELVSTGVIKQLLQTTAFSLYGGDTFVGHNSVITFPTKDTTLPLIWTFPTETALNSGLRYEGENDYEKFYPCTDITVLDTSVSPAVLPYIVSMVEAGIANYYLYNNDYHLLNTIRQNVIDNELTSLISTYPNRIYSSMPQPLESSSLHWKKTKPLDYYDMVNHKGAIYKMLGNEYVIYVQTEYSIFRGIVIDQLKTVDIDVALKTTEMFDRPLQELLDADGSYIRPWNREGTILTPFGLCVADLDKGSVYVISDKNNEVSKIGIEDWFRSVVKTKITFATKETIGSGVILGYDDIYKRLLLTIKAGQSGIVIGSTTSGSVDSYNDFYNAPTNISQSFLSTGLTITSVSVKFGAKFGNPDLRVRLHLYNCVNDLPTTLIATSSNYATSPVGTTINFLFANVYLAPGNYCIVSSYENVVTHNTTNFISFDTVTSVYSGGISAQQILSTWYKSSGTDYYMTVNYLRPVNDFTLSFSLERMFWVAFHSYAPDKYLWNSNGTYGLYGNKVHKLLSNNYGLYDGSYYPSLVDFSFNNNAGERFLLKNIKWTNTIESAGIVYWDSTLTSIMIYSKNLCTGTITLTKRSYGYNGSTHVLEETGNLIYKDGEWIFTDIKDIMITPNALVLDDNFDVVSASLNVSKNWYEKAKFITKFVNIRLSYTNSSSNRKVKITDITVDIKQIL